MHTHSPHPVRIVDNKQQEAQKKNARCFVTNICDSLQHRTRQPTPPQRHKTEPTNAMYDTAQSNFISVARLETVFRHQPLKPFRDPRIQTASLPRLQLLHT